MFEVSEHSRMSICFLLPYWTDRPVGGYKVVYEYANRFAALGHRVTIAYPYLPEVGNFWMNLARHFIANPHHIVKFIEFKAKVKRGVTWFTLDKRVRLRPVFQYSSLFPVGMSLGTCYIATFVWTADCLNRMPVRYKFYFLQDRESWFGKDGHRYLGQTYKMPLRKIAISQWIREGVVAAGSDAVVIPNGLDFEYFRMESRIDDRSQCSVAMLWHRDQRKRTEDAVAALAIVQREFPQLQVTAFGVFDAPVDLPQWITYVQQPDRNRHNEIYNNAAIFVASSEQEGWGLTPCEAMICGCAVACTDIGGYREFAKDGETALMSPARDVEALAANITRLIEDRELRIRIASAGHKNIKQFTWDNSVHRFLEVVDA